MYPCKSFTRPMKKVKVDAILKTKLQLIPTKLDPIAEEVCPEEYVMLPPLNSPRTFTPIVLIN